MSLFKTASNQLAFGKVGLYGPQGSGKTTTAMLIAVGLAKLEEKPRPIFFMDTETGSDFFIERMEKEGIEFQQLKSRAFRDLAPCIKEAQEAGAVLIIDSVSHYWDEIKEAYAKKLKRKKLQFQDWAIVKQEWRNGYATPFVTAKAHIIVCGRIQDIFEDFFEESSNGKLERDIVRVGSRMRAEKEFGYEPSLVLEMESLTTSQDKLQAAKSKKERHGIQLSSELLIRATVIKDRADVLNGKTINFPTFEDFLPHFNALNLGGEHMAVDTERTSEALFSSGSETYARIEKKKEIALEEFKEELVRDFPGTDKASKAIKSDVFQSIFGTRAWVAITERKLDEIDHGLKVLRKALPEIVAAGEEPDVAGLIDVARQQVDETEEEIPVELSKDLREKIGV